MPLRMAYRLALISDIHGNEVALRAVLEDIRRAGVDQIACLGDVATLGPRPREVFERFVAGGAPTVLPHAEYATVEWRAGAVSPLAG